MGRGDSYTEEEDEHIKKYWFAHGATVISMDLGRSEHGINRRARKLGLTKIRRNAPPHEIYELVWNNAGRIEVGKIAELANKSKYSIDRYAQELEISLRVRVRDNEMLL